MPRGKVLPPTYLYGTMALMVVLDMLLPGARLLHRPWNMLGLLPLVAGAGINLWADQEFKRYGTTVRPFQTSAALVTTGAFRFSRNPMYSGFVLGLIGIAMLLGSLTPYLLIPGFMGVITLVFVRGEERMLQAKFGAAWQQYRRKVRRWL
jgi:protein-S-isoprenylcysteine O-methyltransferase Ste14